MAPSCCNCRTSGDHLLLGRLDFANAHGAEGVHILGEHFGAALRHALREVLADLGAGALEGQVRTLRSSLPTSAFMPSLSMLRMSSNTNMRSRTESAAPGFPPRPGLKDGCRPGRGPTWFSSAARARIPSERLTWRMAFSLVPMASVIRGRPRARCGRAWPCAAPPGLELRGEAI